MRRRGAPANGTQRPPSGLTTAAKAAAERLCNLALEHQATGRLAEAERCFRGALDVDPCHAESLNGLGIVAHEAGDVAAAVRLIGEAIAANGRAAPYHYNLGLVFMGLGRTDEAVQHYRRAVALKPDYAAAHTNLAAALAARRQFDEAALHFRRALSRRADQPAAYSNLVSVLLSDGKADEALGIVVRGLGVQPTNELKNAFGIAVGMLQAAPKISGLRRLIARAFLETWHRPEKFIKLAVSLVKENPVVADHVARMSRWPQPTALTDVFPVHDFAAIADDELLRACLVTTPVRDVALERLLTKARTTALVMASGEAPAGEPAQALVASAPDPRVVALAPVARAADKTANGILEFCSALARQCFINEYVYPVGDEELASAHELRDRLVTALRSGEDVAALTVGVVAAYMPLHSLDVPADSWQRAWPDSLAALIRQQVREPADEAALRSSIPALTQIASGVSELVQQQYEANPYPRWAATSSCQTSMPVDAVLKAQFPQARFTPVGKFENVLIAGCGTGRHAIESARLYQGAKILAVDLSLTSLAYAKRKAAEAEVSNIEFGQADILNIGRIGRTFDIVESVGTLHHLRDIWEGWRMLLPMLRPGGFMRIGLYSDLARRDIVAVRKLIAERGCRDTSDAIRQFRQDIWTADDGSLGTAMAACEDFYSVSGCRDLMFHVQENRTSIPEIKAFLAENKLSFIGFEGAAHNRYARIYPADPAFADLDNWHAFEQAHPSTFAGMYQFWVQKSVGQPAA